MRGKNCLRAASRSASDSINLLVSFVWIVDGTEAHLEGSSGYFPRCSAFLATDLSNLPICRRRAGNVIAATCVVSLLEAHPELEADLAILITCSIEYIQDLLFGQSLFTRLVVGPPAARYLVHHQRIFHPRPRLQHRYRVRLFASAPSTSRIQLFQLLTWGVLHFFLILLTDSCSSTFPLAVRLSYRLLRRRGIFSRTVSFQQFCTSQLGLRVEQKGSWTDLELGHLGICACYPHPKAVRAA